MKINVFIMLGIIFMSSCREPKSVLEREIEKHEKAVHVMDEWMRDPFITIGPDGLYYLTATQQENETKSQGAPVWRSSDLINWEFLGFPYQLKDASNYDEFLSINKEKNDYFGGVKKQELRLWAPEMHFINHKWVFVHTSNAGIGNLAMTKRDVLEGPFSDWGANFKRHHDPTLFVDDDGSVYMGARCAEIGKLKSDLSGYEIDPVAISPSNRKMGHEGIYIIKVENKYVLFGTAWSTDEMRHGTYNLYYATSDNIFGPYGERKFAGRFLGHGTPFKDKQGRWWCTAFYNANKPALSGEEAQSMDLSETAYTINKQGLTLVPMEIKIVAGDIEVYAKDEYYRFPGNEEVQRFE